jgi:hypothetical protein
MTITDIYREKVQKKYEKVTPNVSALLSAYKII